MHQKKYAHQLAIVFIILFLLAGMYGCGQEVRESTIFTVADEDAEQYANQLRSEISPSLADGLDLSLWASEELIGDPVAIHVDDLGRVLVTITERRRNSELDIRGHRDWMIESVGFETVEDRRDFVRRELAPERSQKNTWLEDHNEDGSHDWHDLTVNKESIFRVKDVTGNGYANEAQLFVRDFHEEVTDVAGAVLYHNNEVFLGVAPDLWRIKDTNGDGYGDERESISNGYGVNIGFGGHGMSGLTVGPDGRIYWSIGDRGMSVVDADGKRWHHPREGVIVRSEPDGSNFEVYATGLRNTHEFVFDKYGNLITVDNDGDHSGESERLVYLVNGSDSGWRLNWQFGKYNDPKNNDYKVLMDEEYYKPRFEGQAAHILPPLAAFHDGPAGMTYNPGTALSEKWKDHFFVAKFVGSATQSGIHAFTLEQRGASFKLDRDEQVLEGIQATGLDFGPDGALYFADWIEGWALNAEGRVWKLDSPSSAESSVRTETKNLLAEDFRDRPSGSLLNLLGHADMRVRKKAQFELAARDDTDTFEAALEQENPQLQRIHGIWGLAQIGRRIPHAAEPLISLLKDDDSEVRAQAAKMLGDVKYEPAGDALISLLADTNARVRFFATEALGRLSWQPALEPIVKMLEANDDKDIYLRHGGAIALERIGNIEALAALSGHPSSAVRIAAVVALKRLESPAVIPFLKDEDEFVVTNAARAINDDAFIEEGLQALAAMTEQRRFANEPLLRRAINANLYTGGAASARRLAEFALREDVPEPLRVEALQTLSVWEESSKLDRVTGDPRGKVENNLQVAHEAIAGVIGEILTSESSELKIAGLQMVSSLGYTPVVTAILELIGEDPSPEVRIVSLQTLIELEYEDIETAVLAALEDEQERVRMNALRAIPELNLSEETMVGLIKPVLNNGTVNERQAALTALGRIDHMSAHDQLERQVQLLIDGDLDPEIELEVVEAVTSSGSQLLRESLRNYKLQKSGDDSVAVYRESLYGGDAESGREIFYQNAASQCIRCHVVNGEGSKVGPDLTTVGSRLSREMILQEMVDPNARLTPGYGSVAVTLSDGEELRGRLSEETDTELSIVQGSQEWTVKKADIVERTNSPSGMLAMGEVLTRSELRDLVEFLSTLQNTED